MKVWDPQPLRITPPQLPELRRAPLFNLPEIGNEAMLDILQVLSELRHRLEDGTTLHDRPATC